VEAVLSAELGLRAVGYKCDGVMAVALQGGPLESVCQDLTLKVDCNTLRAYLNRYIEVNDLREQAFAINRSLSACISVALLRDECKMALNCHDEPLFGCL